MKKIILFAAFIAAVSFTANAQTVSKKVEKAEKTATVQKDKAKECCKEANAECKDAKAECKEEFWEIWGKETEETIKNFFIVIF